jgi:hypothetical protein
MLVCETAGSTAQDLEDLAVLASQLAALGVDARVHVASVPDGLPRNARFDLAPLLVDRPPGPDDRVLVTAAHRLTDDRLLAIRRLAGPEPVPATIVGAFPSRQGAVGARAKLSYVFGTDPEVVDLGPQARSGNPVFGVGRRRPRRDVPPRLLLVAPPLAEPTEARALLALALSSAHSLAVLTDGESKQAWLDVHGEAVPIYHFGEILPAALAARADIACVFAPMATSYRAQCLIANLVATGAALVDGTDGHELSAEIDAAIPGPPDLTHLPSFLGERILGNLARIGTQTAGSRAAAEISPEHLLATLGLPQQRPGRRRPGLAPEAPGRLVFMPTNGIGLGHAQRCARIAQALPEGGPRPVFAAFPGCMGLVRSYGFDVMPLVSRSSLHAQPHENDLPNYLRLRALARGARGLVFDGGYVFDSVYRTIIEGDLPGIWIRRGLWQATQDNSIALDREKAFTRVIVPGEAFAELNRDYSRGAHVRHVGPIVARPNLDEADRRALREGLAERFGQRFERLVVSLLGAGVAADRSAQIQALSGILERRSEVLHLVVVWPSAVLHPAWFGWTRTRILKTRRAGILAAAADLLVSAAGYNSFHEILYGGIPAIFIPQVGPFMDDQRTRAQAAVERDIAAMVAPTDLVTLDRLIDRMLEGEAEALRARLRAAELPQPGNAEAARCLGEVIGVR